MNGRRLHIAGTAGAIALIALVPASAGAASKTVTFTKALQIKSAVATCPSGTRASGGAFVTPSSHSIPDLVVFESRKVGQRRWRVSAQENGASAVLKLRAFAYCSSTAPKTFTRAVHTTTSGDETKIQRVVSRCPRGTRAEAGGFMVPSLLVHGAETDDGISSSYRGSPRSWRTELVVYSPGFAVTGYSYCARMKTPRKAEGGATAAPDTESAIAGLAECKRGRPISGGFRQTERDPTVSNSLSIDVTKRVGRTWKVIAFGDPETGHPIGVEAFAYCA